MKLDHKFSYRKRLLRTLLMGIAVTLVPVVCYLAKVPSTISIVLTLVILVLWSILLMYYAVRYFMETE